MRIAILGNSLQSLVLAHCLTERDHEVDVYGKPEPLSNFLRDSDQLKTWLPDIERKTIKTQWKEEHSLVFDPAKESVEGYWVKSRNESTPPRRLIIAMNAPRLLKRYLDLERFEPILGPVDSVQRLRIQGRQYDRIITTIAPERFPGLKFAPRLTVLRYFWGSSLTGIKTSDVEPESIVFCGEDHVWWYHAIYTDGRWLHICRSPDGPDKDKWRGECLDVTTGIQPMRGTLRYPIGVIPVGRLAEWRDELTIGETIGSVEQYIRSIEAPVEVT